MQKIKSSKRKGRSTSKKRRKPPKNAKKKRKRVDVTPPNIKFKKMEIEETGSDSLVAAFEEEEE